MINKVKKHIEDCMKSYFNSSGYREDMHHRLDELFLLWSVIKEISFVEVVREFGIDYNDFSDRKYDLVVIQIGRRFPELLEERY